MRYAQIRKMDISNGEGIGVALFVQGCCFHCKNCFNPETWDFDGGYEWTEDVEQEFLSLIDKPYIKRVSILGGEPLDGRNIIAVDHLCHKIKKKFGRDKIIWLYTGFSYEKLFKQASISKTVSKVLESIDVLVDGQYVDSLKDINYPWAGSTNQRVIDVQKSLKESKIVLYDGE